MRNRTYGSVKMSPFLSDNVELAKILQYLSLYSVNKFLWTVFVGYLGRGRTIFAEQRFIMISLSSLILFPCSFHLLLYYAIIQKVSAHILAVSSVT